MVGFQPITDQAGVPSQPYRRPTPAFRPKHTLQSSLGLHTKEKQKRSEASQIQHNGVHTHQTQNFLQPYLMSKNNMCTVPACRGDHDQKQQCCLQSGGSLHHTWYSVSCDAEGRGPFLSYEEWMKWTFVVVAPNFHPIGSIGQDQWTVQCM